MQRWERFYLNRRHVGYQQLEVRPVDGLLRTASLTVFRVGAEVNLSGFFCDASPDDPLAWAAFGCFSEASRTTYVRDGATVRRDGALIAEIPDEAFPGQLGLALCQSIGTHVGATRTYVMIGDGDGQLEGQTTLELVDLDAPLPDATPGPHIHFEERVAGQARRQFYLQREGQVACSVWGPDCWSIPVDSGAHAREGCPADWPTLEQLWPEG